LADRDYVYIWADGVHFRIRLEEDRLCALVAIGVRPDGTKELIAIEDGYRESTESWASLLRDLKRRGMKAPALAVGDGALGLWAALRDVWPETREQRCWVHRLANVLDKLPKRLQPRAKEALRDIMNAESRAAAEKEIELFAEEYGAKYPKAVASLTRDQDKLLTYFDVPAEQWKHLRTTNPIESTFATVRLRQRVTTGARARTRGLVLAYKLLTYFDFPAEHWKHLRTTNPIESTFATVRLRQRVTKGAGSRTRGLVFAYKLLDMASRRWRRLDGAALLPLVRAGVKFKDGIMQERQDQDVRKDAA